MALEHLVLGLVAGGVRHGYAIGRRIDDALVGRATVQRSHVYAALAALERRGLAVARMEGATGRRRRTFDPTPAGRTRLAAWLARRPADAAAVLHRSLLVKLAVRALLDDLPSRREVAIARAARRRLGEATAVGDVLARMLRERARRRAAVETSLLDRLDAGREPSATATRSRPESGFR